MEAYWVSLTGSPDIGERFIPLICIAVGADACLHPTSKVRHPAGNDILESTDGGKLDYEYNCSVQVL